MFTLPTRGEIMYSVFDELFRNYNLVVPTIVNDESTKQLKLVKDLPGVDPSKVKVSVHGRYIDVSAKREDTNEDLSFSYYIDNRYDLSSTETSITHNVLTIKCQPYTKPDKPLNLEVKIVK